VDSHAGLLWVGIGCTKGIHRFVIEQAIQRVFQEHSLSERAIAAIATIDSKASEPGLLEFCQSRHLPLWCFSAAELNTIDVPNPSAIVEEKAGVASVAEAAALLASRKARLLVPKKVVRLQRYPGIVTLAIAD
jgi:cobalamin biosynthesis protein CbiG